MMEMLDRLRGPVARLDQLLKSPEPALWSWCHMVGKNWKEIAELWGYSGEDLRKPSAPSELTIRVLVSEDNVIRLEVSK